MLVRPVLDAATGSTAGVGSRIGGIVDCDDMKRSTLLWWGAVPGVKYREGEGIKNIFLWSCERCGVRGTNRVRFFRRGHGKTLVMFNSSPFVFLLIPSTGL